MQRPWSNLAVPPPPQHRWERDQSSCRVDSPCHPPRPVGRCLRDQQIVPYGEYRCPCPSGRHARNFLALYFLHISAQLEFVSAQVGGSTSSPAPLVAADPALSRVPGREGRSPLSPATSLGCFQGTLCPGASTSLADTFFLPPPQPA